VFLDDIYSADYCRDDRCSDESLHPWHPIKGKLREPRGIFSLDNGADWVTDLIPRHGPTTFQQILYDVHNTFGTLTERTVYRWLNQAIARRQLLRLPNHNGVYVRTDCRLLQSDDGWLTLRELTNDLGAGY
jgi:hypothetical protein